MENVRIWEEKVIIPTYEIGEADKNPMFLEKRVYQGSSGKVYPYPTTEKISREKTDKAYQAVYLENQYIRVMILPELGGRIQRAYDKTNDYDFVYYNHVIKPALVGLVGPWISGGIEFNWPQHHRPTTYMPVDHVIQENEDGSKTVFVHDVDQMYGTRGIIGFTLYPDKAYIEIRGQLYNRTAMPQTFLWWANPAVAVNENTQSVFPPDVHSVMDHGKRDVSRFPIATGVYYKHDYSEGVDISRYKNIPVPTSYMAEKSDYDFVGGYDYGKEAGILHVADHHISPGKKQWTWGCGEFGKAWDRNLTDEDGPYIELMTGVYTDNQPDFTWLKPFEEKVFKQYFMPYKQVGYVKNASTDAILNMEFRNGDIYVCVYGTGKQDVKIRVTNEGKEIYCKKTVISPNDIFEKLIPAEVKKESDIKIQVLSEDRLLVEYQPQEKGIPELAKPAQQAKDPEELMTNEELFLTGQHIEQYRHATYLPDPYYLEGLKRDPGDIRINNAYGLLMMRRCCFAEAEKYFRKALERLTWKNPNPYDSEAYYNLGLALFYQKKYEKAYDAFYKATWSNEQQEMSFYYLACIAGQKKDWKAAMEFVEKGLVKNAHNIKARGLKAVLLRKTGNEKEAKQWIADNLKIDQFDYLSMYELYLLTKEQAILEEMNEIMRGFHENYLMIARDYAESGCFEEAVQILQQADQTKPLVLYYQGYYYSCMGKTAERITCYEKAEAASPIYCFPNKQEDVVVLEDAISSEVLTPKANYYLGCLYYDKLQFARAMRLWEESERLDSEYPTLLRNLALGYYNKCNKPELAREKMEKAFALDTSDARVFLELDQLYKKLNMTPERRLENYKQHIELIEERDDVLIEYVTLLNSCGLHQKAYDTIMCHTFRPWEGAEGKVTTQYKVALTELAKECLARKDYENVKALMEKALNYPYNLGEGRLEGTKDNNLYYYLGIAKEALGDSAGAKAAYEAACIGDNEPAGMMYYYDQPADMILYQGFAYKKLGKNREACARFRKLIDYGEKHIRDHMRIDYFAVSLPDFLIFEENLDKKNVAHCYYLMGLGKLGLDQKKEAEEDFAQVLERDGNHQNGILYRKMAEN